MSSVIDSILAYVDRQVGKKYSQSKRYQEGYFDCSSLVYRAFESAGVKLIHKDDGGKVDVSYREVYAKGFELIFPDNYGQIGRRYALSGITGKYQPGDIVFCSPGKTGKITHVMIANQYGGVTHAANDKDGVIKSGIKTHSGEILAIIRYQGGGSGGKGNSGGLGSDEETGTTGGAEAAPEKKEITDVKLVYSTGGKPEPKRDDTTTSPVFTGLPYELIIQHEGQIQIPVVNEGVTLTRERRSSPSKLTFSVLKNDKLNFQEGDPVSFKVCGQPAFHGYVFQKSRNSDGWIKVTAYDQIRYLKNHDTMKYENVTVAELLQRMAADYGLQTGAIDAVAHKLAPTLIDDKALIDILEDALDMTLIMTGKMYVLYDDFGKLTLKDADSMVLDILINEKVAEDFDYSSGIDSDTYNKIKIGIDNEETGIREIYETQDGATMGQWGVLQKYVKLDDKKGAETIGAAYLKLYNRKSRSLSIKNVMGDIRVRGGSKIPIMLDLGDIALNQQMMVESVTHGFKENEHLMDVTVRGWDFV